jgi:hypothetical protein
MILTRITPLSVTGSGEELDAELPSTIVNFVAPHLQMRNTLERTEAEMETGAKTAPAEVRAIARAAPAKKELAKPRVTQPGADRTRKTCIPEYGKPFRHSGLRNCNYDRNLAIRIGG